MDNRPSQCLKDATERKRKQLKSASGELVQDIPWDFGISVQKGDFFAVGGWGTQSRLETLWLL